MKNKKTTVWKIEYLLIMAVFGCLGPVVREINLPSPAKAWLRACIASVALVIFLLLRKKKFTKAELKKVFLPMVVSGLLLAFDWIGLFSSYNYTTVATATLSYYIVSILVIIGAAIFLKEKLTVKSVICILVAFGGMFFVSGVAENGLPGIGEIKGVLFAFMGACAYAGIVIINKKFPEGDPILRTTIQLIASAVLMTPYIFLTEDVSTFTFSTKSILLLLLLGVVMTALAYIVYFYLILKIPSRSVAIFSYADPIVAVLISVFFLGESMTILGIVGAVMIIGAAIVAELGE